ncbi:MAG: hypothetical protein KGM24_09325, partial [Elusimicrobia bacterium]|nr:hypothetical protein [Elusimicrobiota bacterium]
RAAALAAAALLLAAPRPRAQDEPSSSKSSASGSEVEQIKNDLGANPRLVEAVAQRIVRSKLIGELTDSGDRDVQLAAAEDWVRNDPEAAARVAIGLAHDDKNGNTDFEDSFLAASRASFHERADMQRTLFGKLGRTARRSDLLRRQGAQMSDDERRELLRTLFEGQGAESNTVLTRPPSSKPPAAGYSRAGFVRGGGFAGYYDRLSAGNLHGYSPKLMALQSELSRSRPPGAPRLIETGKLDYATLSYPGYGMDYDARNLEARLQSARILALARASGTTLTARDWKDPDALEKRLDAKAPGAKLPPRLAERAELTAEVRAALGAFLAAAAVSKDPSRITKGLLVELGLRQKEAARWITAAAIDERLSDLDPLVGFLTPELVAAIDAAPVPAGERAAYKSRGQALTVAVAEVRADEQKALDLLRSDAWASSLDEVDRLLAASAPLERSLPADVAVYAKVPFLLGDARALEPRWRVMLDDLAVKWAPGLSYSRAVAARRARAGRALSAFARIASGDPDGARRALSEPAR